jgi:hypothetical protein
LATFDDFSSPVSLATFEIKLKTYNNIQQTVNKKDPKAKDPR